jgi:UrcA family protein
MKSLIALIALSISTFALGTQAQASNGADQPSVIVQYSAHDLASERGVAMLYEKIEAAARSLCENREFSVLRDAYRRCIDSTLSYTIATAGRPELSGYAAARGVPVGSLSATHSRG